MFVNYFRGRQPPLSIHNVVLVGRTGRFDDDQPVGGGRLKRCKTPGNIAGGLGPVIFCVFAAFSE